MQLGVLNVLLGLPNGALNNGQGKADGSPLSDLFSQLLDDPAQGGTGQQPGGQLLNADVAPGALTAQEVTVNATQQEATLSDILNQQVSAKGAASMLQKLDALHDDMAGAPQLKELLTTIKDTKNPQTLGALLAQLHANPEHAPAGQRLLAMIKDNLKQKESSTQEAAAGDAATDAASPVVQSLQASVFRDADVAPEKQKEKTRDYVEIIPLNAQIETAPVWIKNITKPAVRADLDAAIPALSAKAETEEALPELNLPGIGNTEKVTRPLEKLRPLSNDITAQNATQTAPTEVVAPVVVPQHVSASSHSGAIGIASVHGPVNHAPVAEQVHVAISRSKQDGIDQLTLQLDPVDLGRVEIKMHTNSDGQTQLSFLVDKPETLDSLSRDARSLERSLQDSGVKADAGNMQFNLRQQPQQNASAQGDGQFNQRQSNGDDADEKASGPQAAAALSAATKNYILTLHDGVDIKA